MVLRKKTIVLWKKLWCYEKNNDTIPKTVELCFILKKTIMVLYRKLRNFDLLLKKKTMVLYRKIWNFGFLCKKPLFDTENYGTLIYYGKNYGTTEKKLWYYSKL